MTHEFSNLLQMTHLINWEENIAPNGLRLAEARVTSLPLANDLTQNLLILLIHELTS